MRKIYVTDRQGSEQEIDADDIDHIKIALHECEIFFVDGTSLPVEEDFEEVSRRVAAAR